MPETVDITYDSCDAVSRWEDAGKLLAGALSSYLKSCVYLDPPILCGATNYQGLAIRIDTSLNALHVSLARELGQARATLAKTRNKIASPIYSFPNEILAEIFMNVVHVPAPDDHPDPPMEDALKDMYARLHSILSVCTVWRNIGVELRQLWSVVPMGGGDLKSPSRLATALSLKRSRASPSGDQGTHLAALLSYHNGSFIPTINGEIPRFRTLNIQSDLPYLIAQLFNGLLKFGPLPGLSELSIHHSCELGRDPNIYPRFHPGLNFPDSTQVKEELIRQFGALSVLRIRGVQVDWSQLNFSTRLVELRLQSVVLGPSPCLAGLLKTLETAPGLRDLKLISIVTFSDPTVISMSQFGKFSFPKLQSLLLEDLGYTTLSLVFHTIAPGTYQLRLTLTEKCKQIYRPNKKPTGADIQDLYYLFRLAPIVTLLLKVNGLDDNWLNPSELRGLLKSLPALKALKLAGWDLSRNYLLALKRPRAEKGGAAEPFLELSELHLFNVGLWETTVLKRVVSSHSLRRMEFNGVYLGETPEDEDDTESEDWEEFTEDSKVIKWLKKTVPQFRLIHVPEDVDFHQDVWQLW